MVYPDFRTVLLASSAAAVVCIANPAWAQTRTFDIAAQPASTGISAFARQADVQVLASANDVQGRRTATVQGQYTVDAALRQLLAGSGLVVTSNDGRTYTLGLANSFRSSENEETTAVADIIVTAQKREQSIQDVPIAVSAFSAENLDAMKIEGGSELLRAVPNVAFSKNNFSMYNFSIRGVGTKALSSASDPAVAISFNNSPMIRNRLFESEYLDVNRVEVLRGPQGTLYGRNATGGVVNMFPNLPGPVFDSLLKLEAGNYGSQRGQMMLNVPLTDTFWVRGAAATTKRDGFDYNTYNDTWVNGRDLYSYRLSAAWQPNDRFNADFIWERFHEDDNRSRTGKQLCTTDPLQTGFNGITFIDPSLGVKINQGCLPGSLYADAAYGTPNAGGMGQLNMLSILLQLGEDINGNYILAVDIGDNPFEGVVQSKNLREISTRFNPIYRSTNDVFQLNLSYKLSDSITLTSQTLYTSDEFYSSQDYNRYTSKDIFKDSDQIFTSWGEQIVGSTISPGGYYTDPQLGLSRGMLALDLSRSENDQVYQELRISSADNERLNFSIGTNYLKFKTHDRYYVFNNTFSMLAEYVYNAEQDPAFPSAKLTNKCTDGSINECVYVEYNSIENLEDLGHNYFLSKNVVKTESYAVFGEIYYNFNDATSITLGARYTDDEKTTTPYPSQLLLGFDDRYGGNVTGGSYVKGLRPDPDVVQNWQAWTGRAVMDWKPSDDAMLYASYSRGYKGGGTNPPRADINPDVVQYQPLTNTFDPEYVDAFEIGGKFTLFNGTMRLNTTAFYYDYQDYQVSQIVDRISLNENFDATSMGLELEMIWRPTPSFRVDANLGYLKTRIAEGEGSVDVMNRTQGNDDWVLVRPWAQVPSNCIAPRQHLNAIMDDPNGQEYWFLAAAALCGGASRWGSFTPDVPSQMPFHMLFGFTYNPLTDAPNGGRGFNADLGGNELPNSPRWTANVGAQYTWHIGNSELTLRGDYYRQADSYFRVYNTEYDQIRGWDNLNLAVTWEVPQQNLVLQAYVKNVFDDAPIVDAFTNSDDTMLSTNVFTLDPRLWGFSVTKRF